MKEVFILRGLPGAGKSTVARSIAGRRGVVCTADEFLVDRAGRYQHNPRRQGGAHLRCFQKFTRAIESGASRIVVANTSTRRREFARYQTLAVRHGYRVHVLTVENYHGGISAHNVPPEVIDRMATQYTVQLR